MKRILIALAIAGSAATASGQGTVVFDNVYNGGMPNAPFFESDGVTKLSGSQFMAELLAGPNAYSLAAIAMTGFASGSQAGYFFGGEQTISSVAGGATAWVQVDVWNTASGVSFAQAQGSGLPDSWWQSSLFSVQTGNRLTGVGFTPPAPLTGLGTSPLYLNSVPEPSTLSMAALGGALALFYVRYRK